MSPELDQLVAAFSRNRAEVAAIVTGLSEMAGQWRAAPDSWSVAQCVDHLATANRVYLRAMEAPVAIARRQGRLRRRPALPGVIGRWFVRSLEPPVKPHRRLSAPRTIVPRSAPALAEAYAAFVASQAEVQAFMREAADLDLATVRFANPFVRGLRFSIATGLHVLAAHERRHVWQARRVREAAEAAQVGVA